MIEELQLRLLDTLVDQASNSTVEVDDILSVASFILHDQDKLVDSCLDLLDHGDAVREVRHAESDRKYWRVTDRRTDHQEQTYICLERYCSCNYFTAYVKSYSSTDSAQENKKFVMCKHLGAIRLAIALGRCSRIDLPLDKFLQSYVQQEDGGMQRGNEQREGAFHASFRTPSLGR
ncbi:hypothetical protein EON65_12440 [archaeon]|nr:MAG: hypothetical protein EON65_12440 [archaeon]